MKVVPLIILYLGTIERYVRSCISKVSQSCGDFSSQYGNNNQAAHGPSNCKQARQHPSRTTVTVAERVSSRDFKLILITRCENNRALNFGGAGYKLTISLIGLMSIVDRRVSLVSRYFMQICIGR